MAACEKCWEEAFHLAMLGKNGKRQVDYYQELIGKNDCTPEEQAGNDARYCPACRRFCLHEVTKQCMNSECM